MERAEIIRIAETWIAQLTKSGVILEGIVIGSVLREKDFRANSDVDVVLLKADADPLPEKTLRSLQFKIERPLEVIVFSLEQLRRFSPCHRKSNLLLQIPREHPASLIARELGACSFFHNEFQVFWRWHSCLRIIEVYGRDLSLKTYEDQLKTYAARAALTEQHGYLKFHPHAALFDALAHWPTPWWATPQTAATFVLEKLTAQAPQLCALAHDEIPTAREEWLIREFWDERARLTKIQRLGELVQFLLDDAVVLKMKIDKARA